MTIFLWCAVRCLIQFQPSLFYLPGCRCTTMRRFLKYYFDVWIDERFHCPFTMNWIFSNSCSWLLTKNHIFLLWRFYFQDWLFDFRMNLSKFTILTKLSLCDTVNFVNEFESLTDLNGHVQSGNILFTQLMSLRFLKWTVCRL